MRTVPTSYARPNTPWHKDQKKKLHVDRGLRLLYEPQDERTKHIDFIYTLRHIHDFIPYLPQSARSSQLLLVNGPEEPEVEVLGLALAGRAKDRYKKLIHLDKHQYHNLPMG